MTRGQQVAQWKQGGRPLAQAIGRKHYNERRTRTKIARQDTLRALLRRLGRKGTLRLGQVKDLAQAFGVSRRTIHRDLIAILGRHYSSRWRQKGRPAWARGPVTSGTKKPNSEGSLLLVPC